jgi:hypothetical protein
MTPGTAPIARQLAAIQKSGIPKIAEINSPGTNSTHAQNNAPATATIALSIMVGG